jgi:hypothetical protein
MSPPSASPRPHQIGTKVTALPVPTSYTYALVHDAGVTLGERGRRAVANCSTPLPQCQNLATPAARASSEIVTHLVPVSLRLRRRLWRRPF